jgi:hypothetical protein
MVGDQEPSRSRDRAKQVQALQAILITSKVCWYDWDYPLALHHRNSGVFTWEHTGRNR